MGSLDEQSNPARLRRDTATKTASQCPVIAEVCEYGLALPTNLP